MGKSISFNACEIVDSKLYFITNFDNAISVMDMKDNRVYYLENMEGYNQNTLIGGVEKTISVNGRIYFFELTGRKVLIYDIQKNICKTIEIDCRKESWGNFALITKYDDSIYVFPKYGDKYIIIDSKSDNVIFENIVDSNTEKSESNRKFFCGCSQDERVWLYSENNKIIEYNLITQKYSENVLPIDIPECIDIAYEYNNLYLFSQDGRVFEWNVETRDLRVLIDKQHSRIKFEKMIVSKSKIWFLPALEKDINILDLDNNLLYVYQDYPKDFCYAPINGWSKYYNYCEDAEYYYIAMRLSNYMLCINKKNGDEKWIKPILPKPEDIVRTWINNHHLFHEESFSLRNFINGIKSI